MSIEALSQEAQAVDRELNNRSFAGPAAIEGSRSRFLRACAVAAAYALLLWAPLSGGAHEGWPLSITQLLVLAGLMSWLLGMLAAGRLEYRRSALDLPLGLLITLVVLQIVVGNRAFAFWALAPPPVDPASPVDLPGPPFFLGSVFPAQTVESLLLLLTYAASYVLAVNVIRRRRELDRLIRLLLLVGGLLAFLGLGDYFAGHSWLLSWWQGDEPISRLMGTFANPDHFGAWLVMLVCLGIGYLKGRASAREAPPVGDALFSRVAREEAIRRYLPFAAVALMSLALVFTLSRGALVSLAGALIVLLLLFARLGELRWPLAAVGALAVVTLAYGAWIGLGPLLARAHAQDVGRWAQWLSTMPMVKDFPLLGVGLGAYKDIYPRYQPLALEPGVYYYPYAHSDLLQIVVELGPIGGALVAYAIWRVARDLVGAHLFGEARCPVAAGSGYQARRHDRFSVSVAAGAIAAVIGLLIDSAMDFSARIPANGVLGAACLGIATVALHTRFRASGERLLVATREWSVEGSRALRRAVGAMGVALASGLAILVVRPVVVEARIAAIHSARGRAVMDLLLAVDHWSVRALRTRAADRVDRARDLVDPAKGQAGLTERRAQAGLLLHGAIADWRRALTLDPAEPYWHYFLAEAYQERATLDEARASGDRAAAFAHLQRAVALDPDDASNYAALAALAASKPAPRPETAVAAASAAAARDPARLPDLIDTLLPLGLSEEQWGKVVPATTLDRLRLAAALEGRGRLREAERMFRQAREQASPDDAVVARWLLARFLLGRGEAQPAVAELDGALQREPDNPELRLIRGQARAVLDDTAALEDYRAAVTAAEGRGGAHGSVVVFATTDPRARALIAAQLGRGVPTQALDGDPGRVPEGAVPVLRYRRALARYLLDRKLWSQALEAWDTVATQAPEDAEAQFARAQAFEALGRRDRAIETYQKAIALDGRARYRFRLAQLYWSGDQYVQAIEQWRAIAEADPKNVDAHMALGAAYIKIGEPVDGFREYQRVLALVPGHAGARQALARMGTR